MGVFRTRGGYSVKSYYTGKFMRNSEGKIKVFKTKKDAIKAAGKRYHG